MSFDQLPAYRPLMLFSALLVLKMGAMGVATATRRRRSQVVVNPEDTGISPGARAEPEETPDTLRAKRAHLNDLENIPGFLILALLYTLAGGSAAGGWSYFGTFFVARVLHSAFYLNAVQPWRSAAFGLGQLAQLGVIVQLLLSAFRG